ncbi:hypothetical protein BDD12DRAFT_869929 [Trichophaea hybrida]|nr:hypothetical protein BDD12DRAFT_869929 [Trichophaea hybrida]
MEDSALIYLCYELKGPFRRFMVPRECLASFAAVKKCVNGLGFSAVSYSINGAVLFAGLWPAGLTEINVSVRETSKKLFDGRHNERPFKIEIGACQLPPDCVLQFDQMPRYSTYDNHEIISICAVAQTPLTSYEALRLSLHKEGYRLIYVFVKRDSYLHEVHPRAWPAGLKTVYAFTEPEPYHEPEPYVANEDDRSEYAGSTFSEEDDVPTPTSTTSTIVNFSTGSVTPQPASVLPIGASTTRTQNDTRFYMELSYVKWIHFDFRPFTGEFPTVAATLNATIAVRFAEEKPGDVKSKDWLQEFGKIHLRWKTHEIEIDCQDEKERDERLLLWCRTCPSGSVVQMNISRERL